MKTDIIIKSFNRAFYLDRSLYSITKYVSGYNKVIILDDGTPNVYLEKIISKYPFAEIRRSGNHAEKSLKITQQQEVDGYIIPSALWISAVQSSTDYVVVIEDDVWFTDHVNLDLLSGQMAKHKTDIVKLGFRDDMRYLYNFEEHKMTEYLISQRSKKLFTGNRFIMDLLLHNKYHFLSVLCRMGLADNRTINEYYVLSSILTGLYRKEYWLYIWQDSAGRVNEKDLLKNSAAWYHKFKKNRSLLTRTKKEFLETTYISSATNSYHKYTVKFDVMAFNHQLNELWLKNSFNIKENFPGDYTRKYLSSFLSESNRKEFYAWSDLFLKSFNKNPELY